MTIRYHKEIKQWLLDDNAFTIPQIYAFLSDSIDQLSEQWKWYTQADQISQFTGQNAAQSHYRLLKQVADDLQDIKDFILNSKVKGLQDLKKKVDFNLQDYYTPGASRSSASKGTPRLLSTVAELQLIKDFEEEFESQKSNLYDLRTAENDIQNWENRSFELKQRCSIWGNHPVFNIISTEIKSIKEKRNTVAPKIKNFTTAEKLDDAFLDINEKWSQVCGQLGKQDFMTVALFLEQLSREMDQIDVRNKTILVEYVDILTNKKQEHPVILRHFDQYYQAMQEMSYLEWIRAEMIDLKTTYGTEDPTNWFAAIKYKKFTGELQISNYLDQESEICAKNHKRLLKIKKLINYELPEEEIRNYLKKAYYRESYSAFLRACGLEDNHADKPSDDQSGNRDDAFRQEIKDLSSLLQNPKTYEDVVRFHEDLNNSQFVFHLNDQNAIIKHMLDACKEIDEMAKENEKSCESQSGWRVIQVRIMEGYKIKVLSKYKNLGMMLEHCIDQERKWVKVMGDLRDIEDAFERKKIFKFNKKADLETIKQALQEAYEIAPENTDVVFRMGQYQLPMDRR